MSQSLTNSWLFSGLIDFPVISVHTSTLYQTKQWITNYLIAYLVLKQLNKLSISLLFGHCFRFHARPFLAEARVKDVISLALTHVKNLKDNEVSKILGQGWDGRAPSENMKFQVNWKRADSEITNISDSFLILYLLRFKNELANFLFD